MKKLVLILTILVSTGAQADFIESGYLYGLSKRHAKMVNNGGDIYLDLEINQEKGFIQDYDYIENLMDNLYDPDEYKIHKMKNGKKGLEQVVSFLDPQAEPYLCYPLMEDYDAYVDGDECEKNLRKLLGDAVENADSVHLVEESGNYYGDYYFMKLFLIDYDTKEVAIVHFPIFHEI